MRRSLVLLVCLSLFTSWGIPAHAAEGVVPEKEKDILMLLEVTGSLGIAQTISEAIVKHMSENLKAARPDIPSEMFEVLADIVNKTFAEALIEKGGYIDQIVPLYDKFFSHEEIKGLLTFYQTPVGKKAIAVMPIMTRESLAIAQQWSQKLGPIIEQRVKARFKEKGIEI